VGTRQAEVPHPPTDGHGYAVTMAAALDLDRHQEAAPDRAPEDAPCISEAGRVVLTFRWRLQKAYMEAQSKKANPCGLA
jgi:hypothetical protein